MRRLSLVVAMLAGCAAPTAQLSPEMLARLQRESRIEIYDRENDVVIARNKQDEARRRVSLLSSEIETLGERAKKMEMRAVKAGGPALASLQKTVTARRGYLEAQKHLAEMQLAVAENRVEVASARLEQTRQRQLIRTGRALQPSILPFDARVELLEKQLADRERREADMHLGTEASFEVWKSAEDAYAKATGDYDTGIWLY